MTFTRILFAGASICAIAGSAYAGGFAVRQQSVEAQGVSFAGAAAGDGLSSMFWNPATLTQHAENGFMTENNAAIVFPDISSDAVGKIAKPTFVPAGYGSYAFSEDLVAGWGFNAPLGSTTNLPETAPAGILATGNRSEIKTYNLNPSVGYQLSDGFSVGLGLQLQLMDVKLTSGPADAVTAKGDDFGFGVTAGMLLQPAEGTSIGLGFRSSVKHKLKGKIATPGGVFPITSGFESPEIVTLGLRQDVSEDMRVMAGVEWANWSRLQSLQFVGAPGALGAPQAFAWKDNWTVSLGGEYDVSDQLTVRSGVAYETTPVNDLTRGVRVPENDRFWLSVGAEYQMSEKTTVRAAFSHVFMKDGITAVPPGLKFDQSLNIFSLGLTRDW